MFKSLRNALKQKTPAAPPGLRIYAIGDIHGRSDLLDALLLRIDADHDAHGGGARQIIFLGDLIDRGPDPAGVVARTMALAERQPATRFLMGNHEEILLMALDGDLRALRFFCRIGGRETMLGYGLSLTDYEEADDEMLLARLQALVPPAHRDFLKRFEDMVLLGDYAFVHAGVRPGVPLAEQAPQDLRWIREPFLDAHEPHEKMIVHGHTISAGVEHRANRIGIDTGAYASGRLTALILEGGDVRTIDTMSK